jgi:predicted ester cyclase
VGHVVESQDDVVVEGVYSGTHTGPLATPDGQEIAATDKSVNVPYVTMFEVRDGRIASHRAYWDQMAFMAQLGLMPPA